jgi:hypothetical protein
VDLPHLPTVIEQVRSRLSTEFSDQQAKEFFLAMRVLMGLKYDEQMTETLVQSIVEMEDSVEWQKIFRQGLNRGVVEGERLLLLRPGTQKFGAPSDAIRLKLEAIQDAGEISQLGMKLLRVSNWDELFAG